MNRADRYRRVAGRVADAAVRAGRDPADVRLVVACKTFPAEAVREIVEAGATAIGENYVQEARDKKAVVAADVEWHLIGRLQRNKARMAARLFDRIHAIDSLAVAESLDHGRRDEAPLPCLVQVNVDRETTKGGVLPEELEDLVGRLASLGSLRVDGLMTLPAPSSGRRAFAALRELRDRLRLPGVHLKELSMGMSADFEEAILEGATIVRIGSAILGPRDRR